MQKYQVFEYNCTTHKITEEINVDNSKRSSTMSLAMFIIWYLSAM